MDPSDVSLAIEGLKDYAKPEILQYIISVVGYSEAEKVQQIRDKRSASPTFSSALSAISPSTVIHFPAAGPPTFSDNFETSTYRDSEDPLRPSFKSPSILCSQLPMCRRIMYKNAKLHGGDSHRSSSGDLDDDGRISPLQNKEHSKDGGGRPQPFVHIVGKINPRQPKKFDRGRKLHKNPMDGGVREYTTSISNPLYKNYNPQGYVKNDDELAVEFIRKVTQEFNTWLSQFDGELIQLDVEMMIKVMRKDLELSFKKQNTLLGENENESEITS